MRGGSETRRHLHVESAVIASDGCATVVCKRVVGLEDEVFAKIVVSCERIDGF